MRICHRKEIPKRRVRNDGIDALETPPPLHHCTSQTGSWLQPFFTFHRFIRVSTVMALADRREPKVLSHIPIEILRTISDHLDLNSAFQLSLTCRALRDAGESRIWSAIDLFQGLPLSTFGPLCHDPSHSAEPWERERSRADVRYRVPQYPSNGRRPRTHL